MRLTFFTGTRADWGKMSRPVKAAHEAFGFVHVYVGDMHLESRYGDTYMEVRRFLGELGKGGWWEPCLDDCGPGQAAHTKFDAIVVHGDRWAALRVALWARAGNLPVIHIEGGERSGLVDDDLRNAISAVASVHLCHSHRAARRLADMGEPEDRIWVMPHPSIEAVEEAPSTQEALNHYDLPFLEGEYDVVLIHGVGDERQDKSNAGEAVQRFLGRDALIIHPNNDPGSDGVLKGLQMHADPKMHRFLPSVRQEYFLSLLKGARRLIGNSSALLHEAPLIEGLETVMIGDRQRGRDKVQKIPGKASTFFRNLITDVDFQTLLGRTKVRS